MEDDKKKKRNKKKKTKQTTKTAAEDCGDQNHIHVSTEANDHSQVSETTATAAEIQIVQVDVNGHQSNGTQPAILAEVEKPWLKREAILKETIKQLQDEKDHHIRKEAALEETIKSVQNESDSHMVKLVNLEETIKKLQNENDLHTQKKATLEETIKQLRNENDSHTQKEAGLEMNIVKLQSEKDLWLQKEARLEVKISQLLDESAILNLKGESLEEELKLLERDKDCWIQKESISKETIASLNNDITLLHMQVTELEESRNNLVQENQQLAEHTTRLQLQLQNLERSFSSAHSDQKDASEQEDLNAQIEATSALVSKLITENAELVEKVNELFVKLQQQNVADRLSSTAGSDPIIGTANAAEPLYDTSENVPILSHKLESPDVIEVKEDRTVVINGHDAVPAASTDSIGEIVQIPLDDNEHQEVESQAVESSEEKDVVPLIDAPLIGAPFRLVSFVAKYVSGADLVHK